MRITRRTGGGRGDYEISERAGELTPRDLIDHRVRLRIGDEVVIDTGTTLRYRNGKFRLRREGAPLHIPRQVAAALLMPHPVRANSALRPGTPVLRRNAYAIQHIMFSSVSLDNNLADAAVERVIIKNADHDEVEIVVLNRLDDLSSVWDRQAEFPNHIRGLLEEHQTIVGDGGPLPRRLEQIVEELGRSLAAASPDFEIHYSSGNDVLDALRTSLTDVDSIPPTSLEDIEPRDVELRQRSIREWKRWASTRGAHSARFRQNVRDAYQSKCIVCGSSFPRTSQTSMPGVDAAHILPWAQYDLDDVQNGLCLCKTHHWAFDEGLIQIEYSLGTYRVVVPADISAQILAEFPMFDLEALRQYAGPIPEERLPRNQRERPRPEFLERLRAES